MTEAAVRVWMKKQIVMCGSQGKFARTVGVSQGVLSLFLRGKSRLSPSVARRLGLVPVIDYRRPADGPPLEDDAATPPVRPRKRLFAYGDWPSLREAGRCSRG